MLPSTVTFVKTSDLRPPQAASGHLSAAPYPRLGRTEGTRTILVVNDVASGWIQPRRCAIEGHAARARTNRRGRREYRSRSGAGWPMELRTVCRSRLDHFAHAGKLRVHRRARSPSRPAAAQGDEPVTVEVRAPLGPLDDVVAGSVRAPRHSPIAISRGQPRISCDQYEIWLESGQSAV